MSHTSQSAFPAVMRDKLRTIRWRQAGFSAARAGAIAATVLLGAMLVAMAIDWWVTIFDTRVRVLLTLSTLGLAAVVLLTTGVRQVLNAFGWTRAAGSVDAQVPVMEERWRTVASFSQNGRQPANPTAQAMLQQVTSEAVAMSRLVEPRQVVRAVALRLPAVALGIAAVAFVGFMLLNIQQTRILLKRFWSPTLNISATQLASLTGDTVIPRGQSLDIVTEMTGLKRDSAVLTLTRDSAAPEELTLAPVAESAGKLSVTVDVDESFKYRVQAGDGRTEWHTVTAIDFPALSEVRLTVTPPEYVDEPVTEKTLIPGRLRAIQGSQMELALKPVEELKSLTLVLTIAANEPKALAPGAQPADQSETDPVANASGSLQSGPKTVQRSVTLTKASDGWYHFETPLVEDFTLSPVLVSPYDLTNENPRVCRVEVIEDRAPVARIVSPTAESSFNADETIDIKFEAHDDHGIATAELVIYSEPEDGEEPEILAVKQIPLGDQQMQKHVMGQTKLDLKELGVEEGQTISYSVRVTDNRMLELDPKDRMLAMAEARPESGKEEEKSKKPGESMKPGESDEANPSDMPQGEQDDEPGAKSDEQQLASNQSGKPGEKGAKDKGEPTEGDDKNGDSKQGEPGEKSADEQGDGQKKPSKGGTTDENDGKEGESGEPADEPNMLADASSAQKAEEPFEQMLNQDSAAKTGQKKSGSKQPGEQKSGDSKQPGEKNADADPMGDSEKSGDPEKAADKENSAAESSQTDQPGKDSDAGDMPQPQDSASAASTGDPKADDSETSDSPMSSATRKGPRADAPMGDEADATDKPGDGSRPDSENPEEMTADEALQDPTGANSKGQDNESEPMDGQPMNGSPMDGQPMNGKPSGNSRSGQQQQGQRQGQPQDGQPQEEDMPNDDQPNEDMPKSDMPEPKMNEEQTPKPGQNKSGGSGSGQSGSVKPDPEEDKEKKPNDRKPGGSSKEPPRKVMLAGQRSDAGQRQETDRQKLKITDRLDALAKRNEDQKTGVGSARDKVVQIDKMLEAVEQKLNALYKHQIPQNQRGDAFKDLDLKLGDVETFISELHEETRASTFEFVGLQMVDIGSTHVTPARDAVFVAIRKPDSGADPHTEEALHHIVSARELLLALLKKYDGVKQEQELAKKIDEAIKMYTVYVEGSQQLLREAQQNFDPLKIERNMAVVDVDQAYLDRLAEVTRMRRDMLAEFASILSDDPRLRSRYLELIKRRRASLRSQLAELHDRQGQIADEVRGWQDVDENQRDNYWLQVSDLRLDLPKDLAKEAQQYAARVEKQMPLALNPSQGTPALAIQLAKQIAQDIRRCDFEVRELRQAGGESTGTRLSEAAGDLVHRLSELSAAFDQLSFEDADKDGVTDYVQLRQSENRALADQADRWAETASLIERKLYSGLAHVDQQQVTIGTEILRMEMLDIETDLAGSFQDVPIPQEIINLTQDLLRVMERITFNQSSSAFALSRDRIPPAVVQHDLALQGFEEAGKIFDQLRRKTIEALDKQEVPDPNIADLQDPTLDQFLADLEREPNVESQLGIPNRPRNIRVQQESMQWAQNGGAMLGASGEAAMSRIREKMKERLQTQREEEKRRQAEKPAKEMTEEEKKQLAESTDMREMLEKQMQQTLKDLERQAQDPKATEAQKRQLEEMSKRMQQSLKQMQDQEQTPAEMWKRMVENDQAKSAMEALARGETLPDDQWNTLMSKLDSGVGQTAGRTPPEDYRKAIEQYQDRIRELTGE